LKNIVFLLLIVLTSACKKTTSQFENLSQADQDYIRNYASAQCRSKYSASFNNYKTTSAESWNSDSFRRGDGYFQQYLDGASAITTVDIRVWNVIGNDIYFYVTETIASSGTNYFLKLNLVTNAEIIDDLAEDHCMKAYTKSSVGSSGPMTIAMDYVKANTTNSAHYDHYKDTYTLDFSRPAYLGPYKVTRTITTKDTNGSGGTVIGTAKTYTTTYVAKAYVFTEDALYNAIDPNTSEPYYTQNFCEPAITSGESVYRLSTTSSPSTIYKFGFNYTCTPTTIPAGWDLSFVED
jgi:hypothetical protein